MKRKNKLIKLYLLNFKIQGATLNLVLMSILTDFSYFSKKFDEFTDKNQCNVILLNNIPGSKEF